MAREIIDAQMSDEERIDALRESFQMRVSKYSVELWTLTEPEAELLLEKHPVSVLLGAFSKVGAEVKRLREDELVFLSQADILDMLRVRVRSKEAKLRSKGLSHRERHAASRTPSSKLAMTA
jgi:hypothetical protein